MGSVDDLDRTGHRRRLANLAWAEQAVRACLRRQRVSGYLPGQVTYNLGEYPWLTPYTVDAWDAERLRHYADHGVELVQVHEEWNDSQRLYGGDKFRPNQPAALRRFVDLAHECGLKVLLYVSSGFFERTDPDFQEAWARPDSDLVEVYFRYARCSPASPGWRAYLLPRLERILDEWGIDGLYNDLGYLPPRAGDPYGDEVLLGAETAEHGSALEDLLGTIYGLVHRRDGLVKVHIGGSTAPPTDERVYDYLWVGEGVDAIDALREQAKGYDPYVTPCFDLSRAELESDDDPFLHTLPYLQFPLLMGGKPVTGERAIVPGVRYRTDGQCFWTQHLNAIRKHYRAHPEGPHTYAWWDSCPGRPGAQEHHLAWLARYRPLVREGTVAWLEVTDGPLFAAPLPEGVVASLFVRDEAYLVLANYGRAAAEVALADAYEDTADGYETAKPIWLPARSLRILRKR